jgi:hypothetical protein
MRQDGKKRGKDGATDETRIEHGLNTDKAGTLIRRGGNKSLIIRVSSGFNPWPPVLGSPQIKKPHDGLLRGGFSHPSGMVSGSYA